MNDRLTDVATVLGRSRHNPAISDADLAQAAIDTADLPRAEAKPAKPKPRAGKEG